MAGAGKTGSAVIGCGKQSRGSTAPGIAEISIEFIVRGIEQLTTRDDDDVQPMGSLVQPEKFAYQSLGTVTVNSVPQLLGGDDAQPRLWTCVGREEQGEIAGSDAVAGLEDLLKLAVSPHALRLGERVRRHARARL